jgi:hypothetical protein
VGKFADAAAANDEVRGVIAQRLCDGLLARVDVEGQLRARVDGK